ncbi:MAG: CotH kinase family protein, partial [Myxococcota bacterium]|nr:CotH kinase family protein [Myxococcota bacterium]
ETSRRGAVVVGHTGRRPGGWGGGVGWSRLLLRLYRLRFLSGLLAAAPALFLLVWYAGGAGADHLRHNAAVEEDRPLTPEMFHLHLHDHITRDLQALTRDGPDGATGLPTFSLSVGDAELAALASRRPSTEGPGAYVDGFLRRGGETYRVKLRYRGQEPWHWSYPQKSWKLRLQDGRFLDGLQTFNLINTPEPLPFDESLVLDVCREQRLITPAQLPVRLLLNGAYMGVYFFSGQADGDVVVNARRAPGSVYSGNDAPVNPATGVSDLWASSRHWKKVASAHGQRADDLRPLDALLRVVDRGTQREFAEFARDHLDLEKLTLFDAIDVVFGGDQHDFGRNHKLLFDPYRARFEPIGADFRGWSHARTLNRVDNPLLLRLKELPDYLTLRNRIVVRLLDGPCGIEAIRRRAADWAVLLAPDQAADPYWDAYELLPGGAAYLSRMVRPMTPERQQVVLESRLAEYERRVGYLREEMRAHRIAATMSAEGGVVAVDVVVDGHAGYRVDALSADWRPACIPSGWRVLVDRDLDDAADPRRDPAITPLLEPGAAAALGLDVFPGAVLEGRAEVHPTRGAVRSVPQARRFRIFIEAGGCVPSTVRLRARSLVTDQSVDFEAKPGAARAGDPLQVTCVEPGPGLVPGRASLHPWRHPAPRGERTRLGPGRVRIERTTVYGPGEDVEIAPGTTLEMATGASLVFRGRLQARGTAEAPILFVPLDRRWGGIAILGRGAAGSELAHFVIRGGTVPAWSLATFPATLSVHDTRDVRIFHGRFVDNRPVDDVLHAAYVSGLAIDQVEIRGAPADAVDLEMVEGTVARMTVVGAGQEALDLMDSRVIVADSRFLDCGGNGISAGQGTSLDLRSTLVAGAAVGLLVKSGSTARVDEGLFHRDAVAVLLRVPGERRRDRSRLEIDDAAASSCGKPLVVEGGRLGDQPGLGTELSPTALPGLRERVLGLASWSSLDEALAVLRGAAP